MGFIDSMRHRYMAMRFGMSIMREGIGIKASNRGILGAIGQLLQPRWGEPPKRETAEWLDLYGKSPRLNSVHKIASDVAAAEWKLFNGRDKKTRKQLEQHPLIRLLEDPNPMPEMTGYILSYMTEAYCHMTGEAFWLIERNGLNVPVELWIVPPHWVLETPSAIRPFFTVQPMGNTAAAPLPIAPYDMIYFKEPNLLNPYGRGRGRAEGIGDEVETDEYMAKWAKRFFFNDAKPPFVISAPGADKTAIERFQEKWMERYAGYQNSHKPGVIPSDLKVFELGKPQREMDFVESRRNLRDATNQHFMLPPELMGIIENSNRATIDAANYLFRDNVLTNRLKLRQDAIQAQLVWQFDEKLWFEYDNPVPEDKEFNLKVANEGLERGAVDLDEWREKNGFEPLPNNLGKVRRVRISDTEVSTLTGEPTMSSSEPDPAEDPEPEPPPEKIAKGKLSPEQKAALWRHFDKAAIKGERSLLQAVSRYFKQQQRAALSRFGRLMEEGKAVKELPEETDVFGLIERLLDWSEEARKLLDLLRPHWIEGARAGHEVANETFSFGIQFDIIRSEMVQWIQSAGAQLVKGISQATKDALAESLTEGIASGESIPDLRKRVSEVFEGASHHRATMIARTETHGSVSRGTHITYITAGVQRKEWLTTVDGRERSSHRNINHQVRAIDERFSNGLMHPGADGPAGEVIGCRCAELPVFDDDE